MKYKGMTVVIAILGIIILGVSLRNMGHRVKEHQIWSGVLDAGTFTELYRIEITRDMNYGVVRVRHTHSGEEEFMSEHWIKNWLKYEGMNLCAEEGSE